MKGPVIVSYSSPTSSKDSSLSLQSTPFVFSGMEKIETNSMLSGCYKNLLYLPKFDRIIIGHYGSNRISLWNSVTFEVIEYRYTREKIHLCLTYSDKFNRIYSSGLGGQVSAIGVEKNCLGYYGFDIVSSKLENQIERIICLDNQDLVACAGRESTIHLLDTKTLERKGTLIVNGGKVLSDFVYIEKGDVLAVIGGDRQNYIYLFCMKNRKCVGKIPTGSKELSIKGLKFCNSRSMLIAQHETGAFKFWNLNTTDQALKVTKKINLTDKFTCMLLIDELDCFVVGSKSHKLYFYRISTGQLIKTLNAGFDVEGLMLMPKEKKIAASNKNLSQILIIKYE